MKLTIPGILVTALVVASPALAQNNYSGTTSTPGASVQKDDSSATAPMRSKKHMANSKVRHHAKAMSSKPQTTGSGSSSAPGASVNKQ